MWLEFASKSLQKIFFHILFGKSSLSEKFMEVRKTNVSFVMYILPIPILSLITEEDESDKKKALSKEDDFSWPVSTQIKKMTSLPWNFCLADLSFCCHF